MGVTCSSNTYSQVYFLHFTDRNDDDTALTTAFKLNNREAAKSWRTWGLFTFLWVHVYNVYRQDRAGPVCSAHGAHITSQGDMLRSCYLECRSCPSTWTPLSQHGNTFQTVAQIHNSCVFAHIRGKVHPLKFLPATEMLRENSSREAATSGALIRDELSLVATLRHYTAVIIKRLVWPSGHSEDKVCRGSLKTNTAQHGITAPSRLPWGWDRRGFLVRDSKWMCLTVSHLRALLNLFTQYFCFLGFCLSRWIFSPLTLAVIHHHHHQRP